MTKKIYRLSAALICLLLISGCNNTVTETTTTPNKKTTPKPTVTVNVTTAQPTASLTQQNPTASITAVPTQLTAAASPTGATVKPTVTASATKTITVTTTTKTATKKPSVTKTVTKKPTATATVTKKTTPKPTSTKKPQDNGMKVITGASLDEFLYGANATKKSHEGPEVAELDPAISEKCVEWAKKMALEGRTFHAEAEERDWLLEAVGKTSVNFYGNNVSAFERIGNRAIMHTSDLIDSTVLGVGIVEYNGYYYSCVRGN